MPAKTKPLRKEQWLWGNKKLGYSIIAGGVHMGHRYKWTLRSWTNGDFWRQFYDDRKTALKRARDAKAAHRTTKWK